MSKSQSRLSGSRRRAMVQSIADRDGWYCWWCGIPLAMDETDTRQAATLDHLITRGAGGSNQFDNQVIACSPCNQDRGMTPADQYFPKIRYRAPETADNCVPLSRVQRLRVGTLVSRGDAELYQLELGKRVIGSIVHENATLYKNRMWRIEQRATAARPDKFGPPLPGARTRPSLPLPRLRPVTEPLEEFVTPTRLERAN